MIKKCSPGKYRCFSRLWQQGPNFANLPILGSCTYSQSYYPEDANARVKYVAHWASCLFSNRTFLLIKAISHSTIFDIPMHPVREIKDTDDLLPVQDGPQFP